MIAVAIVSFSFLTSCGDDGCTQADWIGTYDLEEGHMCPDTTVRLDEVITISAGGEENTINYAGSDINFTDCNGTGPFGITLALDGDIISVSGLGCDGEYTRR